MMALRLNEGLNLPPLPPLPLPRLPQLCRPPLLPLPLPHRHHDLLRYLPVQRVTAGTGSALARCYLVVQSQGKDTGDS